MRNSLFRTIQRIAHMIMALPRFFGEYEIQAPRPAANGTSQGGMWKKPAVRRQEAGGGGRVSHGRLLLIKVLSDLQTAIIVLERGLVLHGQELLRCGLKALFLIERVAELLLADAGRHAGIAHLWLCRSTGIS